MKKKIAALIGVVSIFILASQYAWADVQMAETSSSILGSWLSILPPLVAIAIALIFRQVLFALFLGIWMGAYLIGDLSFTGIFSSFFSSLSDFIVPGVSDPDRMSIVIFSILIGGMVGIITDNGGTRGVIKAITRFVRTKVQGQVVTSLMGFVVFFDDYANTMVVGNTMRPLTDKLRISRAKLAYLVDATAAPIATIALVSTWIGAMVGFIATAESEMANFNEAAYSVFINSLPYNFYAFFTILFVILIAYSGRDFGTMLKARIDLYKAKHDPKLDKYNLYKDKIEEDEAKKSESHWMNAALPILTLVLGTIIGLFVTGEGNSIQSIVETANSYNALLWGSLASVVVAIIMTLSQKLLDIEKTLEGMMNGMHVMFDGVLILVLAWGLSDVTVALGTADYLVSVFGETLNPYWMPAIVLVLSALTAFATGSSWGTMGILMPLVVPLGWEIGNNTGVPMEMTLEIIYASVSAVLAGSVWGDHCSPISDTTILSSIATQCDHVEHVNTQLPYAMIVGAISILAMIAAIVLNISVWIIYPVGVAIIIGIIYKFGKIPDPETYTPEGKEPAITSLDA
ncbi:MAG: sodium:proton antiporter [Balneola sp.]|nr:sodium:proton antiporter [Balneola sp.]MBE80785.1 sodium:proton antiporter [Balneola sp.]|tara:strand:+ start:382 stop:2097 length:1716 start_codon:yes stop_codon:yes gene_type:complete